MKALILYLKEVRRTIKSADETCRTAVKYGIKPELFAGLVPSKANEYIKEHKLGFYEPGPKLFRIKNAKGGVRGCMIGHLKMWKEVVKRNETTMILEYDSRVVSRTWDQDFEDVLHLDAHRFNDDADAGTTPRVENWTHSRKGEIQLLGTYGYMVKPHAAKRLIQGAYEDGITASDMFVKDKYVKIQVVKPRAVYVFGEGSYEDSLTMNRNFDL